MSSVNKLILVGRFVADPEPISNGGGCKFSFCVSDRKKNAQTGEWEDTPVFIDCSAWNPKGEYGRKLADTILNFCKKGNLTYLEGRLVLDKWTSPEGQPRQALKMVVNDVQLLTPKPQGEPSQQTQQRQAAPPRQQTATAKTQTGMQYEDSGDDGTIPFGFLPFLPYIGTVAGLLSMMS